MVRIAISQAAFDVIASTMALGMILLAAPACAGSRFSGGFHGARLHGGGFPAFHRSGGRARGFFGGYGYVCGYNCGLGFLSGGYDYGYGNSYGYGGGYGGGYGNSYGYSYGYGSSYGYGYGNNYGYGGGAGNAASISNGLTGVYVPDPVGADIPPMIIPTNCWVRRAAYDPSGAYFGQVLVDLCRPSDRVTVTGLKARAKMPDTGAETAQPPPAYRSGSPQSPQ
jgi:hypothetical protein